MIPDDAWPKGDRLSWYDDETLTVHDFVEETSRPYTQAELDDAARRIKQRTAEGNRRELVARAREALAANREYLALKAPTGAQSTAQTRALTRQMNAIIRLVVGDLEGLD